MPVTMRRITLFALALVPVLACAGCETDEASLGRIVHGRTLAESADAMRVQPEPMDRHHQLHIHAHGLPGVEATLRHADQTL